VRPEGMHITLFFVGEADREHASDLDDELSQISIPAFDLRSDRFAYF
jgi:2'-5' RNA ligase